MRREHTLHLQRHRSFDHLRPVRRVTITHPVVSSIRNRIARAQHLLFGQIGEAVASGVRPSEEMKFNPPGAILDDERRPIESLLWWLSGAPIEFGHILPAGRVRSPARRLITEHFLSDPLVCECSRASLRPEWIPVGVVAVVVGIEY